MPPLANRQNHYQQQQQQQSYNHPPQLAKQSTSLASLDSIIANSTAVVNSFQPSTSAARVNPSSSSAHSNPQAQSSQAHRSERPSAIATHSSDPKQAYRMVNNGARVNSHQHKPTNEFTKEKALRMHEQFKASQNPSAMEVDSAHTAPSNFHLRGRL